ncbi:15463_t:CDS:2, partial [Racocetra fulgida]
MSSTSALSRAVMKKNSVPKLLELCYKKLISHKHRRSCAYVLVKTINELRSLEEANPHLMDEDMELWKDHFIRDQPNLSRKFVDSDKKDWPSALEKLRQSKKQHDRQKEEKKIKIIPGLHDPSSNRKNDYYRPIFKQQESITPANSQVTLKNNLRHEPYPVAAISSQRRANSVLPNNRAHSHVNSRITNSAPSRTSHMDLSGRTRPINSRVTNSSVQPHRTVNTVPIAQTRKPASSASIHSSKSSAHIPRNRNANDGVNRRTLDSRTSHSVTKASSRSSLTASTKVIPRTTKSSDNSHIIKTKLDVRQQLYSKNRCDIQNAKTATIKSSKQHLKPKK